MIIFCVNSLFLEYKGIDKVIRFFVSDFPVLSNSVKHCVSILIKMYKKDVVLMSGIQLHAPVKHT